jgi:hypothetical protein
MASTITSSPLTLDRFLNRRGADRFPISREMRYKLLGGRGNAGWYSGETIDMSSTGVLFHAASPLPPGKRLEISISWPALLDGRCGLKLVARCRVTRCSGTKVAVKMDKHEFRTQGARGLLPQAHC